MINQINTICLLLVGPESLEIINPPKSMSIGDTYEIHCEAKEARPSPYFSWSKGKQLIAEDHKPKVRSSQEHRC